MYALGSLLAQTRPDNTNVQQVFQATLNTEVMLVNVANVSASPATFRLFHNDTVATFDEASALYWNVNIAAGESFQFAAPAPGSGIQVQETGFIAVRSSVANALNFTLYGITERAAERTRG